MSQKAEKSEDEQSYQESHWDKYYMLITTFRISVGVVSISKLFFPQLRER